MGTSISPIAFVLRADATRLTGDLDAAKKMLLQAGNAGQGSNAPGIFKLSADIKAAEKGIKGKLATGDLIGAGKLADNVGAARKRLDALLGKKDGGAGGPGDYNATGGGLLSPRAAASVRLVHKAVEDPLSAMTAVLSKVGPAGEIAAAAIELVVGVFHQAIALAGAADPYAMERYDDAWKDLNAVLGRDLVPILVEATKGVRLFADAVLTIDNAVKKKVGFSGSSFAAGVSGFDLFRRLAEGVGGKLDSSIGLGTPANASFLNSGALSERVQLAAFNATGGSVPQQQLDEQIKANSILEGMAGSVAIAAAAALARRAINGA